MSVKTCMKSVLAMVMVVITLFTIVPVSSFAYLNSVDKSLTVSNSFSSMTVTAKNEDSLKDYYASSTSVAKALRTVLQFSYNQNAFSDAAYYPGRLFEVTVSDPGTLIINVAGINVSQRSYVYLFEDKSFDTGWNIGGISATGEKISYIARIEKPGTYYLVVNTPIDNQYYTNEFRVDLRFSSVENLTLKSNVTYYMGTSYDPRYLKFSITTTKVVTISSKNEFGFVLCNSKKQPVNGETTYLYNDRGGKATFRLSKGTYYLKVDSIYDDSGYASIKLTTGSDPTLKHKTYSTFYPGSYSTVLYFKVKPTVSGAITVNLIKKDGYQSAGTITLCNSKRSAISKPLYSEKAVFGITKGTTYYIRVTDVKTRAAIKFTQTSVPEKSGSSAKAAKALKKNTLVKGTITANSSRADFYKITLTKSQKIYFYTTGNSVGSIRLQLYYKNGKKYANYGTMVNGLGYKATLNTTTKLPKGTYYVKVYRADAKSNGYYTLKWK